MVEVFAADMMCTMIESSARRHRGWRFTARAADSDKAEAAQCGLTQLGHRVNRTGTSKGRARGFPFERHDGDSEQTLAG